MKRWQIITGLILVLLGVLSLVGQVFPDLRIGRFLGPLILIGLGVYLILRPRIAGRDVHVHVPVLGDISNVGSWEVTRHEYWWFVGSNRLDFTEALFPQGEAVVRIFGFVNDIKIILPDDVGLWVEGTSFITNLNGLEGKQEKFLSPLDEQSSNYSTAEKRVRVQSVGFVSEIKVRPSFR
jgi:lia operon protein LiaF